MPQRDYILRQIDEAGIVLARLVAMLFGLKQQGKSDEGLGLVQQTLKTGLDWDLEALLAIPDEDFIYELTEHKGLSPGHLHKLAEILYALAENELSTFAHRLRLQAKCLLLYEFLNSSTTAILDFERNSKIQRLNELMARG